METVLIIGSSIIITLGLTTIAFILQRRYEKKQVQRLLDSRLDQSLDQRIEQCMKHHKEHCPALKKATLLPVLNDVPTTKNECHNLLSAFMMTYYPRFIVELKKHATGRLTSSEEHLCYLFKLDIGYAQIAEGLHITPNSVFKTRQRLRQKLKDVDDPDLLRWMRQLGEPLEILPPGNILFPEVEKKPT